MSCVGRPLIFFASALRNYQDATEAIEAAGANAEAMDKAMDRFEKASATMDRVGGWDAETFAVQVCVCVIGKN